MTRNHIIKGRPIDVQKAISKSDIGKIKNLMTGALSSEAAALALNSHIGNNMNGNSLKKTNASRYMPNVSMDACSGHSTNGVDNDSIHGRFSNKLFHQKGLFPNKLGGYQINTTLLPIKIITKD